MNEMKWRSRQSSKTINRYARNKHNKITLTIMETINCKQQKEWKNSTHKLPYIKPRIDEWEVLITVVGNMRLNWVCSILETLEKTHGHLMSRNDQQQTCINAACKNLRLTIKHCLKECPNAWMNNRKIIISRAI